MFLAVLSYYKLKCANVLVEIASCGLLHGPYPQETVDHIQNKMVYPPTDGYPTNVQQLHCLRHYL